MQPRAVAISPFDYRLSRVMMTNVRLLQTEGEAAHLSR
jgi:hypothetical protein